MALLGSGEYNIDYFLAPVSEEDEHKSMPKWLLSLSELSQPVRDLNNLQFILHRTFFEFSHV